MVDQSASLTSHSDLIYDVGMHQGKDTAFYLRKGFRVVAVEASPSHVDAAQKLFQQEITEQKLTIVPAAVSPQEGRVSFFINLDKDDWGTTSPDFAARNEQLGTRSQMVEVDAVRMETILSQHGVPYYMKIDIEGADTLCLKSLHQFSERPKFVSIEIDLASFAEGFDSIVQLWTLGYRDFKLVNQSLNKHMQCPNPPREGKFVSAKFDAHTSGPFGEETPGDWLDIEGVLSRYQHVIRQQRLFGASGKYYHSPLRHASKWFRKIARLEPIGWYDLHARFGDQSSGQGNG
jgi:FkbM family methyltransferase